MNRRLKLILMLTIIFRSSLLNAQQVDSMLNIYRTNYLSEKTYLQFDRDVYSKGETIWFKAYILAGETPSDYSRNFYVDWYNEDGTLLKHTILPIFESSARGMFIIPEKYLGNAIHVKAYTSWMLNFDTSFIFSKTIPIHENDSIKTISKLSNNTIQFFPEGGDMVLGITSKVGFLATDQQGLPISIKGAIFNKKHELIDSIISIHDGMGSFSIEPIFGEMYTCVWEDEYGHTQETNLPVVKNEGIVLETSINEKKTVYVIKRSSEINSTFKQLHIVASINHQLVYNALVNLTNKRNAGGNFYVGDLQTGVLQLTVFNNDWIPIAERVLFVNNQHHYFNTQLSIDTKRVTARSKNIFTIHVPDSISSNLSIAITDASLPTNNSSNIYSHLLLSSDIKGYIHNPAYYFSSEKEEIRNHLDLVLLTHGWRRYRWNDIINNKLPVIKYPMDNDYLQIKGNIVTDHYKPIKAIQQMTMIMQSKDSTKQYFVVPILQDGSFNQRGLIFFDTATLFYQINKDKKLSDKITATFQSSLPLMYYPQKIKFNQYHLTDTSRLFSDNLFYSTASKIKKRYDTTVILKNVTVFTKSKSAIDILDEKYTSGLFSNRNDYSFDMMNDERAKASINVFYYLQNLIPGLSMSIPIMGSNGAEDANSDNVPGLSWRDGSPEIFINEMPADALSAMNLSMTDVAYIKVFKPPFMGSSGSGASGAIAIYTTKPADRSTDKIKGMNSTILTGYSYYKEFYHPDYTYPQPKLPDTRATLYWNPYILTDKKNKTVKISFFNNDITQKFRVIIEGVNAKGKLTRIEKIIE